MIPKDNSANYTKPLLLSVAALLILGGAYILVARDHERPIVIDPVQNMPTPEPSPASPAPSVIAPTALPPTASPTTRNPTTPPPPTLGPTSLPTIL